MPPFIEIKNIAKSYPLKKNQVKLALQNINFQLSRGEIFSLLGVNGAGKTTLSTILATLHPPTSGDVLWNGTSIYKNILAYRKIIGFCPQHPNIDRSLTIEENLIYSARYYGFSKNEAFTRKEEILEQFQLGSYAKFYAPQLSGGYRQRFLIARALMHRPKLLILDEPTVGLDPHIRRQLWKVISQLRTADTTVLLTTHYLDEAETLSDRVCMIHDGSVRLIDTPANLKANHQLDNLEEVFLKFVDNPEADSFNHHA